MLEILWIKEFCSIEYLEFFHFYLSATQSKVSLRWFYMLADKNGPDSRVTLAFKGEAQANRGGVTRGYILKRLDFSTNNNWVYKNGNADIFTIIIPLSDPSLRMVTYFPLLFIEVTMWPGSSVNITFGGEASPVSLSQAGKNYLSSQLLCSLTCPPNKGYLIVLPRLSYK